MNLLGIVGFTQRLEIIMRDKNGLIHWKGANNIDLDDARSYLDEQELDVSYKWGFAAIRIRIVPKGQGILVGEILK